MSSRTITNDLDSDKVALEKLQLEVLDLRWKVRWIYRLTQITSLVVAAVAVAAFIWNLRQFNLQQKESARIAAEVKEKETAAIQRELTKPIRERQLALAFEISEIAAKIAAPTLDQEGRRKALDRFWQLYHGPAIFIEETSVVKNGLIQFANCLEGFDGCDSDEAKDFRLKKLSENLTNILRGAQGLSWEIPLEDLYKNDSQALTDLEAGGPK